MTHKDQKLPKLPNTWLYIGNIDWYTDPKVASLELSALASQYGAIEGNLDLTGFLDKKKRERDLDKLHQGSGFIKFCVAEEVETAAKALDGYLYRSKPLKVQVARARYVVDFDKLEQSKLKKEHERQHVRNKLRHRQERLDQEARRVLEGISSPGGCDAPSAFHQLQTVLPEVRAQLIAEAARSMSLSGEIDWQAMHSACDPARGGRVGGVAGQSSAKNEETGAVGEGQPYDSSRALRKRWQVESFAVILHLMLNAEEQSENLTKSSPPERLTIVDFGCGSGNLTLPLASLFPTCDFIGYDMKLRSIELLNARAAEAGLTNIKGRVAMIEDVAHPIDIVLALHACGNATDFALLQALSCGAAYLVSPCCIGKLKFSVQEKFSVPEKTASLEEAGGCIQPPTEPADTADTLGGVELKEQPDVSGVASQLHHPRSRWLLRCLQSPCKNFAVLARRADIDHGNCCAPLEQNDGPARPETDEAGCALASKKSLGALCKLNIELDRSEASREYGYTVGTFKLLRHEAIAKSDLLIGVPATRQNWALRLQKLSEVGVSLSNAIC
ncbi:hypothetical protein CYMTET_41328 [Cymbomonas tetramitiformis]|uniref:RRM domain-containing protein n=1 Tax=Cymbomonas tetramitiformis TaxID=36881 RepID=A0AAE0F3R6_9CHLO|nr:hypothetical protein CYMTET_41328 [Cymbomonas tetramitiformis]